MFTKTFINANGTEMTITAATEEECNRLWAEQQAFNAEYELLFGDVADDGEVLDFDSLND